MGLMAQDVAEAAMARAAVAEVHACSLMLEIFVVHACFLMLELFVVHACSLYA